MKDFLNSVCTTFLMKSRAIRQFLKLFENFILFLFPIQSWFRFTFYLYRHKQKPYQIQHNVTNCFILIKWRQCTFNKLLQSESSKITLLKCKLRSIEIQNLIKNLQKPIYTTFSVILFKLILLNLLFFCLKYLYFYLLILNNLDIYLHKIPD